MCRLRRFRNLASAALLLALAGSPASSQTNRPANPQLSPTAAANTLDSALAQAEKGYCKESLSTLRSAMHRVLEKELQYRVDMAAARCAMAIGEGTVAIEALLQLRTQFPQNPEVLYTSARFLSLLADQAAQELVKNAPDSYQAAELNAESLESQQRWDDAVAAYRKILEQHPKLPEMHFRIARILLERSSTSEAAEKARAELLQELELNPTSASAEFVLGEVARRSGQWEEAIQHFTRASKLDVGFAEAYLALGMSLSSTGKHAEAILPLERYVKIVPENPAGHYQLAMAYSRTGNRDGAARELELQRKTAEKTGLGRGPTGGKMQ
jgi:tetratricopeptide (TPR) repeat protein